jgi:hypothetical protein
MHYKNLLKILVPTCFSLISVYLIYNVYDRNQQRELIIIYPDPSETKIKPLERGGIVIPNSDNIVYDTLNNQQFSKKIILLPEPEQAIKLNNSQSQDNEFGTVDEMLAGLMPADIQNDKSSSNELQVGDNIFDEELTIFEHIESPPSSDIITEEAPTIKTLNVVKVTESSSKINKTKNIVSNSNDNYKIQLATVKSESQGLLEGERIKRKHLKILSNSNISVKKIRHDNGHFFYLVLAGDYSSLSKAKGTCKKLSSRQQPCMIFKS